MVHHGAVFLLPLPLRFETISYKIVVMTYMTLNL